MESETGGSKLKTIMIFTAIFAAVSIFSLLTIGAFSTSTATVAAQAAEGQLKGSKYLAVLDEDFVRLADKDVTFRERLPGGGGQQVCSLTRPAIQQLSLQDGVELSKTDSQVGTIHFVTIGGDADVNDVLDAMSTATTRVKCIQVKSTKSFFLTAPVHLS